jgi:hypothetical protein
VLRDGGVVHAGLDGGVELICNHYAARVDLNSGSDPELMVNCKDCGERMTLAAWTKARSTLDEQINRLSAASRSDYAGLARRESRLVPDQPPPKASDGVDVILDLRDRIDEIRLREGRLARPGTAGVAAVRRLGNAGVGAV